MWKQSTPTQLQLPVPAGTWVYRHGEPEWLEVERHRSQRFFRGRVAISRRAYVGCILGPEEVFTPRSEEEAERRFDHLLLSVALWARVGLSVSIGRESVNEGECQFRPSALPSERHLAHVQYSVDLWVRRQCSRSSEPWILIATREGAIAFYTCK